jgi:hypothetical protein
MLPETLHFTLLSLNIKYNDIITAPTVPIAEKALHKFANNCPDKKLINTDFSII